MKRKRGKKKGQPNKKPSVAVAEEIDVNAASPSMEDNSSPNDFDNVENNLQTEVDTPSSMETDQPEKLADVIPAGTVEKKAVHSVYGRVKVKLKTSKMIESQPASSDVCTQSDTDKSSLQMGKEKQGVVAQTKEDSNSSSPEVKTNDHGSASMKSGSIKIKSSRSLGSANIDQDDNDILVEDANPHNREPIIAHQDRRYNKQELNAALEVIKKVMKMDAAEPFNVPVNPIALGIPDYFDVIDTPMDFGTICSNLESGVKYLNSEDVYNDVRYIWENCYKYNNKGDYIVDLMKRVKKNFAKYWAAAGLYSDEQPRNNGVESLQVEDVGPFSQGKLQMQAGIMKNKIGKRGFRKHKEGCLCAICILKRKKKEREARERAQNVEDLIGTSDSNMALESRQEGTSPIGSPYGEETSSNLDPQDLDSDAGIEEKGEEAKSKNFAQLPSHHLERLEKEAKEKTKKMDVQMTYEGQILGLSQPGDGSRQVPCSESQTQNMADSAHEIRVSSRENDALVQRDEETAAVQGQKFQESQDRQKKAKMPINFFENPLLLELAGTLFPNNSRSLWSGPHSLVRHQGYAQTSSIHSAIETFMK